MQKSPIKETIFCKETYNCIDPTDRSHPITSYILSSEWTFGNVYLQLANVSHGWRRRRFEWLCCSVLQCVAVYCSVLQGVAAWSQLSCDLTHCITQSVRVALVETASIPVAHHSQPFLKVSSPLRELINLTVEPTFEKF